MTIFPPASRNPVRFGSSVAMGKPNSETDCWKSSRNWSNVIVCQSSRGFCASHAWSHCTEIGNAAGVVTPLAAVTVLSSPLKLAPGSSPNQRKRPPASRGPCQILLMRSASVAVIVPRGVAVPTSLRCLDGAERLGQERLDVGGFGRPSQEPQEAEVL